MNATLVCHESVLSANRDTVMDTLVAIISEDDLFGVKETTHVRKADVNKDYK